MNKREKEWIYVIESNGEQRIAHPAFIFKLLEIQPYVEEKCKSLWDRIWKLEERLRVLETPLRKQKILKLLKEDKGFHLYEWLFRRIRETSINHSDLDELVQEGLLLVKKSGTKTLYGFKEADSE